MLFRRLLIAVAFVALLVPMGVAQPYKFGAIPTTESQYDALKRLYPANYDIEVTDTGGVAQRWSTTDNIGVWDGALALDSSYTPSMEGKTFAFQIAAASATSAASPVITVPMPVAGYEFMTIQNFICNAYNHNATAGSASSATTPGAGIDSGKGYVNNNGKYYGFYQMVGAASSSFYVRGTVFAESDHILRGLGGSISSYGSDAVSSASTTIHGATLQNSWMMTPIPDMTWEGSRYANRYIVFATGGASKTITKNTVEGGLIEPATYPITRLGIHHYGVRGLRLVDLKVEGNSATQCLLVRLNRSLRSDTSTRGVRWP